MILNHSHLDLVLPTYPLLFCSRLIHNFQWLIFCILKHMHILSQRNPYYHRLFPVNSIKRSKESMITFTIQIICSIFRNTTLYKRRQWVRTVKGRSSDSHSSKGWKLVRIKENVILSHLHSILTLKHDFFLKRVFSSQFYTCKGLVCKKGQQWDTKIPALRLEETVNTTLVLKQALARLNMPLTFFGKITQI